MAVDGQTLTNYERRGGHRLVFQDRKLRCVECGGTFTFTVGEQEFYATRGYTNDPKRCPDCRQTRKTERSSPAEYGYRRPREMYSAVCAQCGKECEVPFQPRGDRPVYCNDCFRQVRAQQRY